MSMFVNRRYRANKQTAAQSKIPINFFIYTTFHVHPNNQAFEYPSTSQLNTTPVEDKY